MNNSKISFFSAVLISVNIMIGAGIYMNPPKMAVLAGDLSYLGWFAGLTLFLPVVISFSKLAAYYPGEGGVYNYTKKSLGNFPGFFAAWSYFIGFVGAQSVQTVVLRENICGLAHVYPFSEYSWAVSLFTLFKSSPWVFNFVFLSCMLFLCSFSMGVIARFQKYITVVKLAPLFFIISLVFILPFLDLASSSEQVVSNLEVPEAKSLFDSFALVWKTVPYAIFGYWGFEACCNISHRISGSKKNSSRVILLSFFIVGAIYTLFHFELVNVMGAANLAEHKVEGFMSLAGLLAPSSLVFVSLVFTSCLAVSYFNAIFSELLSYSFGLNILAKEKKTFFAEKIGSLSKTKQPMYAIFVNCILTFILSTFIGDEGELVAITNIGVIASFIFCLISLFRLSFTKKDYLYCFICILGFVSCSLISFYSTKMIDEFTDVLPFVLLIVLGASMYFISRKKGSSH